MCINRSLTKYRQTRNCLLCTYKFFFHPPPTKNATHSPQKAKKRKHCIWPSQRIPLKNATLVHQQTLFRLLHPGSHYLSSLPGLLIRFRTTASSEGAITISFGRRRAVDRSPDRANPVHKPGPEDHVGVVEHAFFERHHDELARAEVGLEHRPDILRRRARRGENFF